jgi:DNA polymerase-3 subunit epsilon
MWFFRSRPPATAPAAVQAYAAAAELDRRLGWREVRWSVLDIETTGLDRQRDTILALGLTEIEHGCVQLERNWQTLVRPEAGARQASKATTIHGILPEDLAQAPELSAVLPTLLERLTGRVLVVHVAAIDVGFLNRELQQRYAVTLGRQVIDTARLAQTLHHVTGTSQAHFALDLRTLCQAAGVPLFAEHQALNDAVMTAQLFLVQATRLEQQGSGTLGDLLQLGRGKV